VKSHASKSPPNWVVIVTVSPAARVDPELAKRATNAARAKGKNADANPRDKERLTDLDLCGSGLLREVRCFIVLKFQFNTACVAKSLSR
jgi:hypothetical protein